MMKKAPLIPFLIAIANAAMGLTNEQVSIKAFDATSNYISATAEMDMVLKDANGNLNSRNLTMKQLEGEQGNKTLLEFNAPADVKGTKLLTYEHIDSNDDQWMYLPSLKKVKRIISSNKSGSFMGTEFSYEDLSSQHHKKFSYSGNAEEVKLAGQKVYKSLRTPKDENSGYSQELVWVEPKNFLIQRIDYYDHGGNLFKSAIMSGYNKNYGVWRVGKIVMQNLKTKKETTLTWQKESIKAGLKEKDFSQSTLK
jgi:outer membrane lipoprotein-sorting protein